MADRKIYLYNIPLEEAWNKLMKKVEQEGKGMASEIVQTIYSQGRVTAEPVFANISAPHYHAAAMDGIAVKVKDTFGASQTTPRVLYEGTNAYYIDTGQPLPEGYNAVIKVEDVFEISPGEIEIRDPATPWQNVRSIGEDIVATELIIPAYHFIRSIDLNALISGGIKEVSVLKIPKVAILPTGSELVSAGQLPRPGQVIDSNSHMLSALIKDWGGSPCRLPIAKDEHEVIKNSIERAVKEYDMVLIGAGSSAGRRDFTAGAIEELGEVLVHGVAIRPGKPLVIGWVLDTPVLGIPGYPVAAFYTMELFVRPLLYRWQKINLPEKIITEAVISRRVVSSLKEEEFLRVKLGRVGQKLVATPLDRGAGISMSLVRADGFIRIPQNKEGCEPGEKVQVELMRSQREIENTVVCIGSHDLSLDLLADQLQRRFPGTFLSSAHVGSMGGLLAIKRGEAHIAGTHLLDEETGEYNIPFLKRLLAGEKMVLFNLAYRDLGLILPRGNPKTIKGIEDLSRQEIMFINRQRGAGTRIFLDYQLKRIGIEPESISGYEREEFTHLSVAAAVASGSADVAIGIQAAARALDLDFISLSKERYDIVVLQCFFELPLIKMLLDVIRSEEFKSSVEALGGYDLSDRGKILWQD